MSKKILRRRDIHIAQPGDKIMRQPEAPSEFKEEQKETQNTLFPTLDTQSLEEKEE
jgi:hypothetical protein